MSPAEFAAVAGDAAVATEAFETLTVDVPAPRWVAAATALRDEPRTELRFFDWLSAYDDAAAGIAVVARLYSIRHRHAAVLRTRVERAAPQLASLTGVWPGADWHERETFEMFGVDFAGHPRLVPLLLPDGFEGAPLRKEFVLASRVAKDWPGAKEPGEGATARPRRRPLQPPGVPEPGTWGPA